MSWFDGLELEWQDDESGGGRDDEHDPQVMSAREARQRRRRAAVRLRRYALEQIPLLLAAGWLPSPSTDEPWRWSWTRLVMPQCSAWRTYPDTETAYCEMVREQNEHRNEGD